jgi:formamidopyrimidine-DNA glycosylase
VHYLRKHVVGKTIQKVAVQEDEIVYGKSKEYATTAADFEKAMTGKKVNNAMQQGKYFGLEMSTPPHPIMHFGMTGWMKFSTEDTHYYRPKNQAKEEWPPRFWKFILHLDDGLECAFVDARRLGRIRLVDVDAAMLRKTTPLKENGPDPVIDAKLLTQEWLAQKLRNKKVPIKAFLLDQANISGVGNWVGSVLRPVMTYLMLICW